MNLVATMFFAFASALAIELRSIQAHIRSIFSTASDKKKLEKLSNHLFATCGTVSELSNYFSTIFLILAGVIFVEMITHFHWAFRILSGLERKEDNFITLLTVEAIFRLVFMLNVICYKADEIKSEVRVLFKNCIYYYM